MAVSMTHHPHSQGVTYFQHWVFAMGVAWRLLRTIAAFIVHASLPFIGIERRLDLEATSAFLLERNRFIENAELPEMHRTANRPNKLCRDASIRLALTTGLMI